MRVAVVLVLLAGGCSDRAHLYSNTGVAYRKAFVRQAEERDVPVPRGIDAIDANIIMQNYRTLMIQKGEGKGKGGGGGGTMSGGSLSPGSLSAPPLSPSGQ